MDFNNLKLLRTQEIFKGSEYYLLTEPFESEYIV